MTNLEPGTPCYLVRLVEMKELVGRVVTVVAGPMFFPNEVTAWYYSVTASWVREKFPDGVLLLSPRKHLQPIIPPDFAAISLERIANDAK
jgi:hypothetical protein